jgi:two-component system LytT family sensor kinase
VTLAEEIDFLEHYLAIQRVRFGERLQVEMHIDPKLLTFPVPSLMLQPLAENAITHGLAGVTGVGHLCIAAEQNGAGSVRIVMRDNGVGLPSDWSWERDAGIGLTTTRSRLAALYGQHQSLTIRNTGSGVAVELTLPGRPAGSDENGARYSEHQSIDR